MKFTILGANGFIGHNMAEYLKAQGVELYIPERDIETLQGQKLGHVIYAIGLTGNFREHPDKAIEAHVCKLQQLMKNADFDSWLYLSSTRVYQGLPGQKPANEEAALIVKPGLDSLYDLSKLLGESICLSYNNPHVRVARLSNVYGAGQSGHTFLGSILDTLASQGGVTIQEAPESEKDYVSVQDVVKLLYQIALNGKERLYNIASGQNIQHKTLAEGFDKIGYKVEFAPQANSRILPVIVIKKIVEEFKFHPRSIVNDLRSLFQERK